MMSDQGLDESTRILLNEYSICQSSIESLDSSVWQSAGIIGLVTIGTFALIVANLTNRKLRKAVGIDYRLTYGVTYCNILFQVDIVNAV